MFNKDALMLLFESRENKIVSSERMVKALKRYISRDLNLPLSFITSIIRRQEIFINVFNMTGLISSFIDIEFVAYHSYSSVSEKFKYGNVLIYIPELELYQLFSSINDYKAYIERRDEIKLKFCQLVLISVEHKFILRCENNPDLINKIENILGVNCVEVTDFSTYVQLTFNTIKVSSFVQEQTLFEKITREIINDSIYIPRHGNDNRFIENKFDLDNRSATEILKSIEKYVMQIGSSNMVNTITNSNISNSTVNVNMTITKPDNKSILEEWLKLNPIENKVAPSEYRQKFADDTGITIHPNTFGKIASNYVESISGGRFYQSKKLNK